MRIDVSGHRFVFPHHCACCGSEAHTALAISATKDTGKRVTHSRTNTWDIPYCHQCVQHAKAAEAAFLAAYVLAFLSILGGIVLWATELPYLSIQAGGLGLVGAILLHNRLISRAKGMCGPTCVTVSKAVSYLGWHGTLHMFDIQSSEYALAFAVANQSKLMNVLPEIHRLLESKGYDSRRQTSRSPRRFMK